MQLEQLNREISEQTKILESFRREHKDLTEKINTLQYKIEEERGSLKSKTTSAELFSLTREHKSLVVQRNRFDPDIKETQKVIEDLQQKKAELLERAYQGKSDTELTDELASIKEQKLNVEKELTASKRKGTATLLANTLLTPLHKIREEGRERKGSSPQVLLGDLYKSENEITTVLTNRGSLRKLQEEKRASTRKEEEFHQALYDPSKLVEIISNRTQLLEMLKNQAKGNLLASGIQHITSKEHLTAIRAGLHAARTQLEESIRATGNDKQSLRLKIELKEQSQILTQCEAALILQEQKNNPDFVKDYALKLNHFNKEELIAEQAVLKLATDLGTAPALAVIPLQGEIFERRKTALQQCATYLEKKLLELQSVQQTVTNKKTEEPRKGWTRTNPS